MKVPDFNESTLYFATTAHNSWATEIQSVVFEMAEDLTNPVFLGHECRRERTPDGEPTLEITETLIRTDSPGEFIPLIRDGRFYEIPTLDTVVPESLFAPLSPKKAGDFYFIFPQGRDDWRANAQCPWTTAEPVPFDSLIRDLNEQNETLRRLFVRFSFDIDGQSYVLFAPCRYLNFLNAQFEGESSPPYLQPITGSVLLPFQKTHLFGYLVSRCTPQGTIRSEFVTPRFVPVAPQMITPNADEELKKFSPRVGQLMPAYTRLYDAVMPLDGAIDFFRLP